MKLSLKFKSLFKVQLSSLWLIFAASGVTLLFNYKFLSASFALAKGYNLAMGLSVWFLLFGVFVFILT